MEKIDTGTDHLLLEKGDGIAVLTMNRPEARNAMSGEMNEAMQRILAEVEVDPEVRCVVLTGAGNGFCAGGDVLAVVENRGDKAFMHEVYRCEYVVDQLIHRYPKPLIPLMDGIVMGGGAGLMFASTYKIATERAKFAMPEIGVGLFPDVGFTSVIKDLPEGLGLYIMLTASPLDASELRFCNLVDSFFIS